MRRVENSGKRRSARWYDPPKASDSKMTKYEQIGRLGGSFRRRTRSFKARGQHWKFSGNTFKLIALPPTTLKAVRLRSSKSSWGKSSRINCQKTRSTAHTVNLTAITIHNDGGDSSAPRNAASASFISADESSTLSHQAADDIVFQTIHITIACSKDSAFQKIIGQRGRTIDTGKNEVDERFTVQGTTFL